MMKPGDDWWQTFFSGVALDLWRQAVTDDMTRAEADVIERLLRTPSGSCLLDVPCGNGRLAFEFAARGYRLTGVDIASEFIDEARAASDDRMLDIRWKLGDMRDLPWEREFDGAFCVGNSFGYLDDQGNLDFLLAVARTLKPGGRFIVDTPMVAESLLPSFERTQWYEFGDIIMLVENRYDLVTSRLHTEYAFIRDGRTERRASSHRVYAYGDLVRLFGQAGFTFQDGYGGADGEPFDLGSPRLLLVAVKNPPGE